MLLNNVSFTMEPEKAENKPHYTANAILDIKNRTSNKYEIFLENTNKRLGVVSPNGHERINLNNLWRKEKPVDTPGVNNPSRLILDIKQNGIKIARIQVNLSSVIIWAELLQPDWIGYLKSDNPESSLIFHPYKSPMNGFLISLILKGNNLENSSIEITGSQQ